MARRRSREYSFCIQIVIKRWSFSMICRGLAGQELLNMTRYAGLIASFEYTTVSSVVSNWPGIPWTYRKFVRNSPLGLR